MTPEEVELSHWAAHVAYAGYDVWSSLPTGTREELLCTAQSLMWFAIRLGGCDMAKGSVAQRAEAIADAIRQLQEDAEYLAGEPDPLPST